MESWIEATALAIRDKEVQRKSDNRTFTIYTIETDYGELTTAKRELAEQIFHYLHKPARYRISVQQKGNFTNTYLEEVQPLVGPEGTDSPPSQAAAPATAPDSVRGETVPNTGPDPRWTEKDMAIYRQTAAKVSASVSRTPEEFWSNLEEILGYFVDGTKPAEFGGN